MSAIRPCANGGSTVVFLPLFVGESGRTATGRAVGCGVMAGASACGTIGGQFRGKAANMTRNLPNLKLDELAASEGKLSAVESAIVCRLDSARAYESDNYRDDR